MADQFTAGVQGADAPDRAILGVAQRPVLPTQRWAVARHGQVRVGCCQMVQRADLASDYGIGLFSVEDLDDPLAPVAFGQAEILVPFGIERPEGALQAELGLRQRGERVGAKIGWGRFKEFHGEKPLKDARRVGP